MLAQSPCGYGADGSAVSRDAFVTAACPPTSGCRCHGADEADPQRGAPQSPTAPYLSMRAWSFFMGGSAIPLYVPADLSQQACGQRRQVSMKLPDLEPEDLPSDFLESFAARLTASSGGQMTIASAAARRGCVIIVLDVIGPWQPQATLAAVASAAGTAAPADASGMGASAVHVLPPPLAALLAALPVQRQLGMRVVFRQPAATAAAAGATEPASGPEAAGAAAQERAQREAGVVVEWAGPEHGWRMLPSAAVPALSAGRVLSAGGSVGVAPGGQLSTQQRARSFGGSGAAAVLGGAAATAEGYSGFGGQGGALAASTAMVQDATVRATYARTGSFMRPGALAAAVGPAADAAGMSTAAGAGSAFSSGLHAGPNFLGPTQSQGHNQSRHTIALRQLQSYRPGSSMASRVEWGAVNTDLDLLWSSPRPWAVTAAAATGPRRGPLQPASGAGGQQLTPYLSSGSAVAAMAAATALVASGQGSQQQRQRSAARHLPEPHDAAEEEGSGGSDVNGSAGPVQAPAAARSGTRAPGIAPTKAAAARAGWAGGVSIAAPAAPFLKVRQSPTPGAADATCSASTAALLASDAMDTAGSMEVTTEAAAEALANGNAGAATHAATQQRRPQSDRERSISPPVQAVQAADAADVAAGAGTGGGGEEAPGTARLGGGSGRRPASEPPGAHFQGQFQTYGAASAYCDSFWATTIPEATGEGSQESGSGDHDQANAHPAPAVATHAPAAAAVAAAAAHAEPSVKEASAGGSAAAAAALAALGTRGEDDGEEDEGGLVVVGLDTDAGSDGEAGAETAELGALLTRVSSATIRRVALEAMEGNWLGGPDDAGPELWNWRHQQHVGAAAAEAGASTGAGALVAGSPVLELSVSGLMGQGLLVVEVWYGGVYYASLPAVVTYDPRLVDDLLGRATSGTSSASGATHTSHSHRHARRHRHSERRPGSAARHHRSSTYVASTAPLFRREALAVVTTAAMATAASAAPAATLDAVAPAPELDVGAGLWRPTLDTASAAEARVPRSNFTALAGRVHPAAGSPTPEEQDTMQELQPSDVLRYTTAPPSAGGGLEQWLPRSGDTMGSSQIFSSSSVAAFAARSRTVLPLPSAPVPAAALPEGASAGTSTVVASANNVAMFIPADFEAAEAAAAAAAASTEGSTFRSDGTAFSNVGIHSQLQNSASSAADTAGGTARGTATAALAELAQPLAALGPSGGSGAEDEGRGLGDAAITATSASMLDSAPPSRRRICHDSAADMTVPILPGSVDMSAAVATLQRGPAYGQQMQELAVGLLAWLVFAGRPVAAAVVLRGLMGHRALRFTEVCEETRALWGIARDAYGTTPGAILSYYLRALPPASADAVRQALVPLAAELGAVPAVQRLARIARLLAALAAVAVLRPHAPPANSPGAGNARADSIRVALGAEVRALLRELLLQAVADPAPVMLVAMALLAVLVVRVWDALSPPGQHAPPALEPGPD
eukprot:XP_001692131.1 predicted protein [Chlamydomonas reinhardtii]